MNSSSIGYHTISKYKKAHLVLMNEKELRHDLEQNSNHIELMKKLQKIIKCEFIAITQGKEVQLYTPLKLERLNMFPHSQEML